jgi:hypothetical protein
MEFEWEHCGDGVYVKYDGYGLWLHANSHAAPTDKIYLEPNVTTKVLEYKDRCEEAHALAITHEQAQHVHGWMLIDYTNLPVDDYTHECPGCGMKMRDDE